MQRIKSKTKGKIHFIDPNEEVPFLYRLDEGLQYGLGFFETILIRDKAFYLMEHLHRLNHSLEHFGFDLVVSDEAVKELIETHCLKNVALKLIVTEKNLFATVRPIAYDLESYQRGRKVTISRVIRSQNSQIIIHKTLNYGENILELRSANQLGYDDCLFVNEVGHVTESAIANLFVIQNDKLITPPVSDGLLPGIIRQKIIDNYTVYEDHISKEQLMCAQGAFLTNSLLRVMPILQVEGVNLPRHQLCEELWTLLNFNT